MKGSSNYLHQLTWLRGFASFVVVMSHIIYATRQAYFAGDQAVSYAWLKAFDMGDLGVLLFFTLSGATLYISSRGTVPSVFNFYIKRIFRIWPGFVIALFAYVLFSLVFRMYYGDAQGNFVEKHFLTPYDLQDILAYLTLTFNIFGQTGLFNGAFWSLPVEFNFYLIFPFILYALARLGVIGPILVGAALLGVFYVIDFSEQSDDFFRLAYSFCGGVLLGYFYTTTTKRFSGVWAAVLLPLTYAVCVCFSHGIIPMPPVPFLDEVQHMQVMFAFAMMTICMFTTVSLPSKIQHWLEIYGTISYSTYLYHNLIIGFLVLLVVNFEIANGPVRYALMICLTLVLTHVVALVSYRRVELPGMALGKRLASASSSKEAYEKGRLN